MAATLVNTFNVTDDPTLGLNAAWCVSRISSRLQRKRRSPPADPGQR